MSEPEASIEEIANQERITTSMIVERRGRNQEASPALEWNLAFSGVHGFDGFDGILLLSKSWMGGME